MNVFKIDRSVIVDEKAMRFRKDELYKLVNEIMDQHDLETLMIATLSKIAFTDYLLGLDVMENKRLESMINVVNNNRKTNHELHDFYIRF
jgi:redox-regulated HSP33 family molecular chaperone